MSKLTTKELIIKNITNSVEEYKIDLSITVINELTDANVSIKKEQNIINFKFLPSLLSSDVTSVTRIVVTNKFNNNFIIYAIIDIILINSFKPYAKLTDI